MPASIQIEKLPAAFEVTRVVLAFENEPFLILFDSAARHRERDARYTFLTADPIAVTRLNAVGERCGVSLPVQHTSDTGPHSPFAVLRQWQKLLPDFTAEERNTLPPFCGGIAGLMSYELGHAFERIPRPAIDDLKTPALLAGLFDWAIVWDHIEGTVTRYVLTLQDYQSSCVDRVAWIDERLQQNVDQAETSRTAPMVHQAQEPGLGGRGWTEQSEGRPRVSGYRPPTPATLKVDVDAPSAESQSVAMSPQYHRIEPTSEIYSDFTRDQYIAAVAKVIEYIRAGDIFQANLSQRLMAPWTGTAMQLYASIRTNNPAPFCGLLKTEEFSIVSASPERFLKVDRLRQVETRPIKGTRRRPRSPIADLYASDELSTSEKDRAENVMIVDLMRNDISRSCKPGTVRVTGLCEVEKFETVLHLVSTVVGTLRDDCDVWDLMAGCFPGGSITGAPKIRAMEIIAELEPTVRGAYCGSLFFLGPCGDFDSSILIRTFTLKDGLVHFPVGGGIVADSVPLEEYRETLHKASGMIRSLRNP